MGFIVSNAFISRELNIELKDAYVAPPRNTQIGTLTKQTNAQGDNMYRTQSHFSVYHNKQARDDGGQPIDRFVVTFDNLSYEQYEAQTASQIYGQLAVQIQERYPNSTITSDEE